MELNYFKVFSEPALRSFLDLLLMPCITWIGMSILARFFALCFYLKLCKSKCWPMPRIVLSNRATTNHMQLSIEIKFVIQFFFTLCFTREFSQGLLHWICRYKTFPLSQKIMQCSSVVESRLKFFSLNLKYVGFSREAY